MTAKKIKETIGINKNINLNLDLNRLLKSIFDSIKRNRLFYKTEITSKKNILWEYKIPRFLSRKDIRKEHIKSIRPICRKCRCELRQDFSYPIEKTTFRTFSFTCPNCNLVHNVQAENLRDYFSELARVLAHRASGSKS